MKLICLFFIAVLLCGAAPVLTNAVPDSAIIATTNVPAAKLIRTQCEALTKSGNRCKRNAVPGEKLCRQHQKIFRAKAGPK